MAASWWCLGCLEVPLGTEGFAGALKPSFCSELFRTRAADVADLGPETKAYFW